MTPEQRSREYKKGNTRRMYGVTLAYIEQMWEDQGRCCALCGEPVVFANNKDSRDLAVVDHCHKTGKVRGVLHGRCNLGLGNFLDSPEICERAAAYLRR